MIKINGVDVSDVLDWATDDEGRVVLIVLTGDDMSPVTARYDNKMETLDVEMRPDFLARIAPKDGRVFRGIKLAGAGMVGGKIRGRATIETSMGDVSVDDTGRVDISMGVQL